MIKYNKTPFKIHQNMVFTNCMKKKGVRSCFKFPHVIWMITHIQKVQKHRDNLRFAIDFHRHRFIYFWKTILFQVFGMHDKIRHSFKIKLEQVLLCLKIYYRLRFKLITLKRDYPLIVKSNQISNMFDALSKAYLNGMSFTPSNIAYCTTSN